MAKSLTSSVTAEDRVLTFELAAEIEQLRTSNHRQAGRTARTLVKSDNFRIVLVSPSAGTHVAEHKAAGPVSVQGVVGRVCLHTPEGPVELRSGDLLVLASDVPHDVVAVEDSAFLVTIAWPEDRKIRDELANVLQTA